MLINEGHFLQEKEKKRKKEYQLRLVQLEGSYSDNM